MRDEVQDLVEILCKESASLSEAAYDALVNVCAALEKEYRHVMFVDDGMPLKTQDEWD